MTETSPLFGYYLTVGKCPDGRPGFLAIITDGNFQAGDRPVTCLTLEVFQTKAEAKTWFDDAIVTKPWETRQ